LFLAWLGQSTDEGKVRKRWGEREGLVSTMEEIDS